MVALAYNLQEGSGRSVRKNASVRLGVTLILAANAHGVFARPRWMARRWRTSGQRRNDGRKSGLTVVCSAGRSTKNSKAITTAGRGGQGDCDEVTRGQPFVDVGAANVEPRVTLLPTL